MESNDAALHLRRLHVDQNRDPLLAEVRRFAAVAAAAVAVVMDLEAERLQVVAVVQAVALDLVHVLPVRLRRCGRLNDSPRFRGRYTLYLK